MCLEKCWKMTVKPWKVHECFLYYGKLLTLIKIKIIMIAGGSDLTSETLCLFRLKKLSMVERVGA